MEEEKLRKFLPHLAKVFDKLNKKEYYEGEVISGFDFDCRIEENALKIYDKRESYHYYYEEEMNEARYELEMEFGCKIKPYTDKIFPQIEQALKQDGFEDEVLEWENNVIMCIHIPEKIINLLYKQEENTYGTL